MNDKQVRIATFGATLVIAGSLGVVVALTLTADTSTEEVPVPGPTIVEKVPRPYRVPVPGPTVTKKVVITKTVRPKAPKEVTRSNERKYPSRTTTYHGSARGAAQSIFGSQFSCAASLISHESGWNVHATNPSSGAYGLPQALPGSKMSSAGSDWQSNPYTQLRWMKSYVDSRYGGACSAWSFWQSHHWY